MNHVQVRALLKISEGPQTYVPLMRVNIYAKTLKYLTQHGYIKLMVEKPKTWELTDQGRREAMRRRSPIPESSGSVG